MTYFNSNINHKYLLNKPQLSFKANEESFNEQQKEVDITQVQLPDFYKYSVNKENSQGFKETIKKFDVMNMVYPWLEHPLLMLGTSTALALGVDKFSKSCGGEYDKSLLAKAAKFGDKIEQSKIVNNKHSKKAFKEISNSVQKVNKFFKNSDLINAIKNTPSMPEWTMVKHEMYHQEQRVAEEFMNVANTLHLFDDATMKLDDLGLSKTEKEFVKSKFKVNSISKAPKEDVINTILLKRLGRSESQINSILANGSQTNQLVKNELLNELGLTKEFLEQMHKDGAVNYVKEVKEAVTKVKGKVRIGAGRYSWMGKFQPFERTIGCDELFNRFHSMTKGEGAKTSTGKFMSKFLQKLHRGFTFGGGKLGVLLMVTPILVETMLDVKKAEKDQKLGTGAHGVITAGTWVFTFPLALGIMHRLGGMQYAGMSEEKVKQYRNLIKEFNEKVVDGNYKTSAEYEKALKILKNGSDGKSGLNGLKKVKDQNLLTKIGRKLASFMTMDLETIKPYKDKSFGKNLLRKLPNNLKNIVGVPLRLVIWGVLSMGVLEALITKSIKSVFGNYYDRFKEEEYEANKNEQKKFLKEDLHHRLLVAQAEKLNAQNSPQQSLDIVKDTKTKEQKLENELQQKQIMSEKFDKMNKNVEENNSNTNNINEINPKVSEKTLVNNSEIGVKQSDAKQDKIAPILSSTPSVANNELKTDKNLKPDDKKNINSEQQIKKEKIDNYTYIPSSENVLNKDKKVQENKYIPSQVGAKFVKTFDNSGLESALKRADRAEQKALEVLSGKFDN